jgi:hypothetical protein
MYSDSRVSGLVIKPTPAIQMSGSCDWSCPEVSAGTLNKDANGLAVKRKAVRCRYAGATVNMWQYCQCVPCVLRISIRQTEHMARARWSVAHANWYDNRLTVVINGRSYRVINIRSCHVINSGRYDVIRNVTYQESSSRNQYEAFSLNQYRNTFRS